MSIKSSPCIFYVFVAMGSPRIGVGRLVRVIILRNDNASGIVHLSSSAVSVQEDTEEAFLNVVRSGGVFGEVLLFDIGSMIFSYDLLFYIFSKEYFY